VVGDHDPKRLYKWSCCLFCSSVMLLYLLVWLSCRCPEGMDIRRCVAALPMADGASSATRLGEIAVVTRFGDVAEAAKAGIVELDAVADVKFGDAEVKFGEAGRSLGEADRRLGEAALKFGDAGARFGDAGACSVFDMVGRKLGDVAKESDRFDGAVAKSALKSGEVEPATNLVASFDRTLGHTVSTPSSI
jgi:hypothetical protein